MLPFMLAFARRWFPLALLAVAALWLRTHDLPRRPMHADEANQAVKFGELLASGRYAFDPRDHHGPTLYYAALPIAWLRGQHSLAAIDEITVRLVPALAGTLAVLLLYFLLQPPASNSLPTTSKSLSSAEDSLPGTSSLSSIAESPPSPSVQSSGAARKSDFPARPSDFPARRSNFPAAPSLIPAPSAPGMSVSLTFPGVSLFPFLAAAFLAVSPTAVYYSRYFIQETLLLTFSLATFLCARLWWQRPSTLWSALTGLSLGLMLATKASAPLFPAAALLALAIVRPSRPSGSALFRGAGVAVAAAALTAALFYSSFGTHLAGLRDAFAAYGFASHRLASATGHEKPWFYYLQLLTWRADGGLVFQQLAFIALATAGACLAWLRRPSAAPSDVSGLRFLRAAVVYTLVVGLALSVTPYKTPWHAIHLVPGLAVLAAGALAVLPRRALTVLFAAAVLWLQFNQTELVAFLRPADARNPYAYVHSSPDVLKFRPLADAALARHPGGVIRIIGEEYWPLPWYLRGLPQVGYWSTPPSDCDGALVVATATQADAVRERLHGTYHESLLGLRPGVLCVVFTPTAP